MMLTMPTLAGAPWRWLGRLRRPTGEPVEISAQRYGYLPARFRHQGTLYRVARVERIWEERGRGSRADRRSFTVSCTDGRQCTLTQELRAGTWQICW
jgi:hypothetical protein